MIELATVLWWIGIGLALGVGTLLGFVLYFHFVMVRGYLKHAVRIFQEKPLFIVPQGQPLPDAEQVTLPTTHGLTLHGCYLHTSKPRKGVILFGLEFGCNCWGCEPYCDHLRENGYDIFAFEMRGQGESLSQPGYEPLQWVTQYELDDFRAALAYLKKRPDADPRGIGFFGISKGGSAGLFVACEDEYIRCCATDGIFATHTTVVPYMRKWVHIYAQRPWLVRLIPDWYYGNVAHALLKLIRKKGHCRFPHLEWMVPRLAPRPWLMIHGEADTYIKPDMARALFELARPPKEIWIVSGAKHNQALQIANGDYQKRTLAFFDQYLGNRNNPSTNGTETFSQS